jgi:lysophospholipase L1-like esterase
MVNIRLSVMLKFHYQINVVDWLGSLLAAYNRRTDCRRIAMVRRSHPDPEQRGWILRSLLWPVYLLVALVLLELLLQLGSLLVKDQARQVQAQWLTGHTRILALGDSNTYGFYLAAAEAWPAQLEQAWNAANPTHLIEVLNLGYPGTNSFRVRDNLPGLLDKLSPDVVLIMVGFNDFWTPVESLATEQQPGVLTWIRNNTRLYRLYAIWSRSRVTQQDLRFGASRDPAAPIDVKNIEQHLVHLDDQSFYLGTLQGEPARDRRKLADNLEEMISVVRARGIDVYLLTYPSNWGFYPGANKWLKLVAEKQKVPLVDITPLFVARCADGATSCPELLFYDGHATAKGNKLVADEVLAVLSSLLR